ncbi:MAG TPA: hypothetical protein VGL14_09365 [Methylomirabilota bacterium]|jgi:hypothetical protein
MTALAGVLVVIGLPIVAVVGLLKLVDALQARHARVIARQIEVTDAIHREFGAIVAPFVTRVRGGWRVTLPLDPRHPDAAAIVDLAARTFGAAATVEVALVAPPTVARRRPAAQNKERIASAMSA